MPTTSRRQRSNRITISTGPWTNVMDSRDPWDDKPNALVDAQNMYIPDPQGGSGLYARRGFGILNLQHPYTGRGQGVYDHVVAPTSTNFVIAGGRLLRANQALTEFTDVTPTVAINALPFTGGTLAQPSIGDTLTGLTSGATGVITGFTIQSGDVATNDEAGWFTITPGTGTFVASEPLVNTTHAPGTGGYLPFTGGNGTEPVANDTLMGASTGATGTIVSVIVSGGSFGGANATGWFVLNNVVGNFSGTESLKDGSNTVGTANGTLIGVIAQTNGTVKTSMATISPTATHVYCTTLEQQLIINDEVNPPWIASDLSKTPVTGTIIDYDGTGMPGSGDTWAATGQPVVYAGSLFFILKSIAGVLQPPTITWSVPGNPAQGYEQDDGGTNAFDYQWTLEQTNAHPLYALAATNVALFYFRDYSIGALAGTPGPDFQGSATHDVVSVNVGCLQSATVQQYGQTIFFCDALGRPYALQPGSPPIPIWLNMRQAITDSTSNYPTVTANVAVATIHPNLNLYIVALFSPVAGVSEPPVEAFWFDTKTLAYVGRLTIRNGATFEAMGIWSDSAGFASLIVLGNEPPSDYGDQLLTTQSGLYLTTQSGLRIGTVDTTAGRTGVIWGIDATVGDGDPITSEDGLFVIASEDGSVAITSENRLISWLDDGIDPIRSITTQRLGYADDTVYNFDHATIITESSAPCTVTVTTPTTANTLEGTPAPFASQDGTYRLVCGLNAQGRGCQVTVSPTTADEQWIVQSVRVVAIPSLAGWQEA